MEVILCQLLWQGGKNEKKKFNLVSWKQVIQSQERGGPGIRSPNLLNETTDEDDYDDQIQFLPKSISKEMNDTLNKEIDEEEVRKTIWALQLDKAPGPDGFRICFYRAF